MPTNVTTDPARALTPLTEAEMAAVEGGSWLSKLLHHLPPIVVTPPFPPYPLPLPFPRGPIMIAF
jgi:hypothetical protein